MTDRKYLRGMISFILLGILLSSAACRLQLPQEQILPTQTHAPVSSLASPAAPTVTPPPHTKTPPTSTLTLSPSVSTFPTQSPSPTATRPPTETSHPHRLVEYDPSQWIEYVSYSEAGPTGAEVRSIALAPDGTLWVAISDGVFHFDGSTWTKYTVEDGLAENYSRLIAVDAQGTVWAIHDSSRISSFDGTSWQTYESNNGNITSIACDAAGAIWFSTYAPQRNGEMAGVLQFFAGQWRTYNKGIEGLKVWDIELDANGVLWSGTDRGLARLDGETWQLYPTTLFWPGETPVLHVAAAPDGAIWFLAEGQGMTRFEDGGWTNYRYPALYGSFPSPMSLLIARDGQVWVGGMDNQNGYGGALVSFDGNEWTQYVGLPFYMGRDILQASDGALWFATESGVFKYLLGK
ncbi:MAG: two-component regulator propeller domain-containing protein [Chloroflexota bacterium]